MSPTVEASFHKATALNVAGNPVATFPVELEPWPVILASSHRQALVWAPLTLPALSQNFLLLSTLLAFPGMPLLDKLSSSSNVVADTAFLSKGIKNAEANGV